MLPPSKYDESGHRRPRRTNNNYSDVTVIEQQDSDVTVVEQQDSDVKVL